MYVKAKYARKSTYLHMQKVSILPNNFLEEI
jgi:hypothetical protein